jgi:hypothetical protein
MQEGSRYCLRAGSSPEFKVAKEAASMSTFPPESEPRRLPECSEARGTLLSVFFKDGFAIATFAWGAVSFPEELEPKLRELIGQECAILRLDGNYHCRAV